MTSSSGKTEPALDSAPSLTLDAYAELSVRLALYPEQAQRILHERGLSDAAWELVSAIWDERLSQSLDEEQPDSVPAPFAVQYAEAIQRAQLQHVGSPLGLDLFCSLLAALRAGKLPQVLHSHALSMGQFMAAQSYWMQQAGKDAAVRQRLMGKS